MKVYQKVLLFCSGLGLAFLLASFAASGSYTVRWNGEPCVAGTQYGFPLPFLYSMNRQTISTPQTHSTSICPTSANVIPLKSDASQLVLDYLFWFAISLPIVFGVIELLGRKERAEGREREERETSPAYGFEPPLPTDP
jgi:hypothetical protein